MKITKRQLKRIIREEYSRLKRRGLIRENKDQALEFKSRALEMINYLEKGDDLGLLLMGSNLKELVLNGDKERALEEIEALKYDTETAGEDKLLQKLERLIEQM